MRSPNETIWLNDACLILFDDDDNSPEKEPQADRKKEKEEDPETAGRTPLAMKQRLFQALPEKYHSAIEHDEIKTIAWALIYQHYPPRDLLLDFAMLSEEHFLSFRCPNRVFAFALFEGNTSILRKLLASEHIDPHNKISSLRKQCANARGK